MLNLFLRGGGDCNTPKYTLVVLNVIRVYYKCILKNFAIIILLNKEISEFGINTRVKGKLVIYQFRTQRSYDKNIIG